MAYRTGPGLERPRGNEPPAEHITQLEADIMEAAGDTRALGDRIHMNEGDSLKKTTEMAIQKRQAAKRRQKAGRKRGIAGQTMPFNNPFRSQLEKES